MANLAPPTAAAEIFDDDFRVEAFDLIPLDATTMPHAFEPIVLSIAVRSTYLERGLVAPLDFVIASPSGRHERREIAELPIALVHTPVEGGAHRYTLREQAHNGWWGAIALNVRGEPS